MANDSGGRSGGVGFFDLLGLLFIGLKLAGVIDWSWWLVLAPIWGAWVLIFIIAVIAALAD